MTSPDLQHESRGDFAQSIRALTQLTDAEVCTCTAPDREQDGLVVACLRCHKIARPETLGLLRLGYRLAPEGEA